jgi:hypothetical protein
MVVGVSLESSKQVRQATRKFEAIRKSGMDSHLDYKP